MLKVFTFKHSKDYHLVNVFINQGDTRLLISPDKTSLEVIDFAKQITIKSLKVFYIITDNDIFTGQLRIRIIKDKTNTLQDHIKFYYHDGFNFEQIGCNRFGVLDKWPRGYMDAQCNTSFEILDLVNKKRLKERLEREV